MPAVSLSRNARGTAKGSALVIVLFFVILLSLVTIAFLARSQIAVKVSASSTGETKAGILANSASDIIIGDLRQEIIAGSAANAGTASFPVYIPSSNLSMVPFQNGIPSPATTIPNLISRSVSPANTGTDPYVPYTSLYTNPPSNRAANDPTAAMTYSSSKVNSSTPSLNGRFVSPAQWNTHFLIPRNSAVDTPGSTSTDSTPVTTFVPPDWVIVTRGGVNSVAWSTGTGGLNDATLTNTNYAVGRYAYAIYDEGGLLDMNAAGFPADPANPGAVGSNGLTTAQSSRKGSLALADLTQLSVGSGASAVNLTQAQIDNFVGWRNYASAQFTASNGTYGSFVFSPTTATNWLNRFVLTNTTGYLQIASPAGSVPSDQAILSRQQLISVIESLGVSPDFLQYLGSFSRALEQPSFVPNPKRPSIIGGATALPPATSSVNTYVGNNTYAGGENAINMTSAGGFLSARASSAFFRNDGTTAVTGEPLVKTRFPLSRLAWLTYAGPSADRPNVASPSASGADADLYALEHTYGISVAYLQQGTDAQIKACFGLTWDTTNHWWIYNHGSTTIQTLAQVTTRDPDFAELLKAAINVGSVGKAGPSGQGVNDQYTQDVSGDIQIVQIMADLIDQQRTDNYPTCIQYTQSFQSTTTVRNIYGEQDLPYFYRWNYFGVTTQVPSPLLSSADQVTVVITPAQAGPPAVPAVTATLNHTRMGSSVSPGSASYMIIPQVWNPHDANTPVASGGGPTNFRITAETNYSGGTASTAWGIFAVPGVPGASGSGVPNIHFDGAPGGSTDYESADFPVSSAPAPLYMTPATTFLQFADASGGKAFREPTILWRNNFPAGVTLTGTSRKEDASLTGNTYYGLLISDTPVAWTWTDPKSGISYISQTSSLQEGAAVPGASGSLPNNIMFRMQYQDASGNWVNYQETYVESTLTDYPGYSLFVNKNEPSYASDNRWANPFAVGLNAAGGPFMRQQSGTFDPRSNRFTAPIAGSYTSDDPTLNGNPTLDAVTYVGNNISSIGSINSSVATSNFVLMKTNRPTTARGQIWEYTTPCRGYDSTMHWYSSLSTTVGGNGFDHSGTDANCFDGLLSQNNPTLKVLSTASSTAQSYYYEDPDGLARRAMGAYVGVSGAPGGRLTNATTTVGLPLATAGTVFTNGIAIPSSQSQSRPILLHRPFRSVAEMSYAFRGTPWKNIDFFTPESGDSALLDVFCVNEVPSNGLIAGKVDLNTRQAPVLKAIFSEAYRDEFANLATPPASGTLPALSTTEAGNLANTLVGITQSASTWEGPLTNLADLVGHFVFPDPGLLTATDVYQYTSPANNTEYTFGGFSAALSASSGIWDSPSLTASQNIQRFRESAIRPLAGCGQTRVWNLLIDIVAQTGKYPKTATGLDQFLVDGQKRVWLHVAIDRYTGQVLDKQVEVVTP
jgi:hypothetical protein